MANQDLVTEVEIDGSDFIEEKWDYGYGGESVMSHQINAEALAAWIEARERRLLEGMTVVELASEDWRLE